MKRHPSILPFLVAFGLVPLLGACTSTPRKPAASAPVAAVRADNVKAKPANVEHNDLEEYDVDLVPDPLEPINRVTFSVNHQIYRFVLRPISKGYEKIVPTPVRKGIRNAYENVRFPVRLVNNALQGNFTRARQELEKFLINTSIGVGGIIRQSDRIPSLAEVPPTDTGVDVCQMEDEQRPLPRSAFAGAEYFSRHCRLGGRLGFKSGELGDNRLWRTLAVGHSLHKYFTFVARTT